MRRCRPLRVVDVDVKGLIKVRRRAGSAPTAFECGLTVYQRSTDLAFHEIATLPRTTCSSSLTPTYSLLKAFIVVVE